MTEACYFYGTLMAEEVIGDVLCGRKADAVIKKNKLNTLQLEPAVLKGYRRYAVKHATYPGILASENKNDQVQGILCKGLSLKDVDALDNYEGDEYQRYTTTVMLSEKLDKEEPDDKKQVSCQVYVWIADKRQLEDHDWDYEYWRRHYLPSYSSSKDF
ncbi:Butirosin biosynthesis, BtrG-like protein [Halteromyces radiatus]|uniref:Butirosin biosynthesis, BtrG-like protein n=1 Tax=Halteromyces radiatus TaxID=101107 RepID=UPI00221E3E07|nr:Butirosin biosynthesis, BtrG-like protein [Halteromyces radiatus]KAI8081529.1 Butirosin biosynthesis, BtrG-like protein [Halteromyces radiatus]